MKSELKVKAIEKGTVIDHIKAENLYKILSIIDKKTPLLEAFKVADEILKQGIQ